MPFWFREPDQVTPEFIRSAAIDALNAGETFCTQNLAIASRSEAIANYLSNLHGKTAPENIAVTNSGMSALMITTQALVGPGDRVVVVTAVWPNLVEIPKILGAESVAFPLTFSTNGWSLDLGARWRSSPQILGRFISTLQTIRPVGLSMSSHNEPFSNTAVNWEFG